MLMGGPSGLGKRLLARGVPSILPPMSFDESLTVTKIYSVAALGAPLCSDLATQAHTFRRLLAELPAM
jgi:predicted ATPase with chaperone activity